MPEHEPDDLLGETRAHVRALPNLSPRDIYDLLAEHGYRGQEKGRRAVSLMAYRHVKRLRRLYVDHTERSRLVPKLNYLLIGPTGCGKTHLVELLFQKILRIPTVVVDITNYSETGYVGDDVKTVLTQLVYAAEGNPLWASCGIVCLDEFDKLASGQSNVRFEGEGTTKDVTGFGVQKELLRMLEAGEVVVPMDFGYSRYGNRAKMSVADISFVACGAFSGFKALSERRASGEKMGFRWTPRERFKEKIAVRHDEEELNDIETFQIYGFLPELLGRFTRIVSFEPLTSEVLKEILETNVLSQFHREFQDEGLTLTVEPAVLDLVVDQAIKRQTGARGLNSLLTGHLEEAAFEGFHTRNGGEVVLTLEDGNIRVEVRKGSEG